jgi:hypothetical protein
MGSPALLLLWRKVCCEILLPIKSIIMAEFEAANLESNDKHTNHYTAEATRVKYSFNFNFNFNLFFCFNLYVTCTIRFRKQRGSVGEMSINSYSSVHWGWASEQKGVWIKRQKFVIVYNVHRNHNKLPFVSVWHGLLWKPYSWFLRNNALQNTIMYPAHSRTMNTMK